MSRRHLAAVAVLAGLVCPALAGAAPVALRVGTLASFVFPGPVVVQRITAAVDIKPESLQKKSSGDPVTAAIELPAGYPASAVDPASVRICREPCGAQVTARSVSVESGNRLKARFDRGEVINLVADVSPPALVTFTVTGMVTSPAAIFSGSDTVRLVD